MIVSGSIFALVGKTWGLFGCLAGVTTIVSNIIFGSIMENRRNKE